MKTAHMFMTKEALCDLIFGCRSYLDIEKIVIVDDNQILFTLKGDDLPNECSERSHQVRLTHTRDSIVVNGEAYSKDKKEIKLR